MMIESLKTTWRVGAGFFCIRAVSLSIALVALPFFALAQGAGGEGPAPFEVQVFGEPGFSGALRSLVLERGRSYAYFERLDDEQISAVRSLKAGAAVGAVLFRHAYFVSRDQNCAATLGSDETPDLIWTGATADFLPARQGTSAVDEVSDAGAQGYASAILFRRADGPPPGALLMKRRRSYGKGCGNILRSLNFDRRFVPIDFQTSLSSSGERTSLERACVNLRGAKVEGKTGTAPVRLSSMLKSDRIALLQPSDLDQGYRKRDRRFRAVLFDGDNCQGESVRIDAVLASKSGESSIAGDASRRDLLLSNFLFRDRVRSLRVVASEGAARIVDKVASAAPTATVESETPARATPVSEPKKAEKPTAIETPKSDPVSPVLASKTEPADAKDAGPALNLDEPKASPLDVEAGLGVAEETQAKTGLSTAKLEPMTELPVQTKAAAIPEKAAVTPTAVVPSAQPLQVIETSQLSSSGEAEVSTPALRFADEKTPTAQKTPGSFQNSERNDSEVQVAQTQEESQPGANSGAEPATPAQQVFTFPVYDVYRLNYCLTTKGGCGEAAASKWCELKGFKRALAWQKDNNIGGIFPTFLIGESKICAQYRCDGFAEVTCGN